MMARAPRAYRQMFGEALPAAALRTVRLPPELVRHFSSHSSQTDVRVADEILRYLDGHGSPRRW